MKWLTFVLGMIVPVLGMAELVARDQVGNYVILRKDACQASQWLQKDWKMADLFYDGRRFKACWRLAGQDVYLLDAAGDVSIVPAFAFKEETGV